MKKLMLVTVVTFASVSALASKARLSALQNSRHVVDIQEVFQTEPDQALNYEAATVEFGGNGTAAVQAEGGFIRKMGDSAWSLYLGRSSTTYSGFVASVDDAVGNTGVVDNIFGQANPLQLTYATKAGDIAWGVGAFYVGNDFKTRNFTDFSGTDDATVNSTKQNIGGVLLGANNGVWDAQLRLGLVGETEANFGAVTGATAIAGFANDKVEINSTSSIRAAGGYKMDTMYYYGSYTTGTGEVKVNGAKSLEVKTDSAIELGAVNSIKNEGTDFFYGASVLVSERKTTGLVAGKTNTTRVPLLVGVEAEVNSWLVLRGALSQDFAPLSTTKTTGTSAGSVADNTTTTVGAGVKWGKANIDWVAGTGTDGQWGTDEAGGAFTNIGLTYNF